MQLTIGILSRNAALYSTKRLIEAIEQVGHIPKVIDHLKSDIVMEQDLPTIYYNKEKLDYINAVIPRIVASVTFYGIAVVRQF